MEKVISHQLADGVTVYLHSPGDGNPREVAAKHGIKEGAVCWVKPASHNEDRGFLEIVAPKYGNIHSEVPDVYADCLVTTDSDVVIGMRVADCPVLVLHEKKAGRTAVAHCGRAAMTPLESGPGYYNIVTRAYSEVIANTIKPEVVAYVVGSICPNCFKHDEPGAYDKFVQPFDQVPSWEKIVVASKETGALDLRSLIRHQLLMFGVHKDNIVVDDTCTYETDWLASYRRDGTADRNTVLLTLD